MKFQKILFLTADGSQTTYSETKHVCAVT